MISMVKILWLVPVFPLVAAGICAVLPKRCRRSCALLAIGSIAGSFAVSLAAFVSTLPMASRSFVNFRWFYIADSALRLGLVLDPLTALMLVMVTFVGALIFIYSVGYMADDENFARFFCFLSLFAAAMLGIIISNSLLLLFICWELVGLASYLLIGFWYHKPSAAAAAKKAFITTRVGDIGFFIGILWLYSQTGTLLFYDNGHGCLETSALNQMVTQTTVGGMAIATAISLLLFCGAIGKSGQLPLHVWLPDAMEGPTPVSALIHAATMVAAGVFLVARVYPLMSADGSTALQVVTWVGAITAFFAASVAVAQNDIKRILAYSTISQLGYTMMGLGVGGVAVGVFHLITHAFFKALLFLGAGSVIHGCHHEQDIRKMGGLRKLMPVTFATYAVGMMALCGVPLFFSGFWSKDAILDSTLHWPVSRIPFYLGAAGAFLTAFYMTRQMYYVFFGAAQKPAAAAHESPRLMTIPLIILAVFAVVLGFVGTPAFPWLQTYLMGEQVEFNITQFTEGGTLMLLSAGIVVYGIWLGISIYRKARLAISRHLDPLEISLPLTFTLLCHKFLIDEIYNATIVRLTFALANFCDWFERNIWASAVEFVCAVVNFLATISRATDENVVNVGFDEGCESVRDSSWLLSKIQNGQIQRYMRAIGLGLCVIVVALLWGCR